MKSIIVTLTDERRSFSYDLELRCDRKIEKLKLDIAEVLCGCNPDLYIETSKMALFVPRKQRLIGDKETLEEAGVWNGDYIHITEKENSTNNFM
ncbi:MAG: hypothetical protein E7652_00170 [Ruminococcaceae bacterium]|nr:hypothetical protein [Oscillospiraceae bacterium]